MDRQSQFIQGYRVLYRQTSGLPSPGPWQTQDVKIPSERSVILSGLKKGIVYEVKVRPYFNEFQGMDSESRTARTSEEGKKTNVLFILYIVNSFISEVVLDGMLLLLMLLLIMHLCLHSSMVLKQQQ